ILKDVDTGVDDQFTKGEADAKAAFTADYKARIEKYKDDRYSGVTGWGRWTADLFTGLPAEANNLFAISKQLYEQRMEKVISGIADFIGQKLGEAKNAITDGRREVQAFVAQQPKDLQKVAGDAAKEIGSEFDQLETDVNDKQQSLVDDLASKYVEARNAV